MRDLDHTDATAADHAGADREGTTGNGAPSRRSVFRVAAGAGAAGVAATALSGVLAPAAALAAPDSPRLTADEAASKEAIIVHVRDAAAGEIDVFHGTSQVHVKDRDLAARIVRATR
jgi:hypothetical protein